MSKTSTKSGKTPWPFPSNNAPAGRRPAGSVTPDGAAIQAAWVEEAERRMQRYRAGQTTAVPVEQAIDGVEQFLRESPK
jgi:hypothetical protein